MVTLVGLLLGGSLGAADAVGIQVQAATDLGPVNSLIFGQNLEAADPWRVFSPVSDPQPGRTGGGIWDPQAGAPVPAVIDLAREAGVSLLRYPGGDLVHGWDWTASVGERPRDGSVPFGLDAFLATCHRLGAEPLIMVSDFTGSPQGAANLVEYLNAPADPHHPWAMKRATLGHPTPYHVTWFELGNETDNHDFDPVRSHPWSAQQYAAWFLDCARRMRAVDPAIRLQALTATTGYPDSSWNPVVFTAIGTQADAWVVHLYPVGIDEHIAACVPGSVLMEACMATGEQLEDLLGRYRARIRQYTGKDTPLAITEYNAMCVQEHPEPYRFAFGPALMSADFVRIMLEPGSHVAMAAYWQFINGYWGMVRSPATPGGGWQRMPADHLFQLWAQHFGGHLVMSTVHSPRRSFAGIPGHTAAAAGTGHVAEHPLPGGATAIVPDLASSHGPGWTVSIDHSGDPCLTVDAVSHDTYIPLARVRAPLRGLYSLDFQARWVGAAPGASAVGLGLGDQRGWEATHSGIAVMGVATQDWRSCDGRFVALPDCPGVDLIWRLQPGAQPLHGRLELRRLTLTDLAPECYPAYPTVTAIASRSGDGGVLHLVIFNKDPDAARDAVISITGSNPGTARRWTVTGPDLAATNVSGDLVHETVHGEALIQEGPAWHCPLPAASMTAIDFALARKPK